MKPTGQCLLSLAFALFTAVPGYSAGIANGSFELPGELAPGTFSILVPGNPTLAPWIVGGTNLDSGVALHNGAVGDVPPVDGAYTVVFNPGNRGAGDWLAQTFDTVPGQPYKLTFNVARYGNVEGSISLRVSVRDATGGILSTAEAVPPKQGFGSVKMHFLAKGSQSILEFVDTSLATAVVDLLLDNVVVSIADSTGAEQTVPSSDDLWDVSWGAVITGHSPLWSCEPGETAFDARDIFGGDFGSGCDYDPVGEVVYGDFATNGFIHFVEWAMPEQVTIRSFRLWAYGDGAPFQGRREFSAFRLLAKSPGSATYDLTLYTFTPGHPYNFVDNIYGLLIETDITPTTAREFRAEFLNDDTVYAPRVFELDGFGGFVESDGNRVLAINSAADYVEIPDSDSLDLTDQLTLEAWINAAVVEGAHTIVGKRRSEFGTGYNLIVGDGCASLGLNNDPGDGSGINFVVTSAPELKTNIWYHVAGTYDGKTAKIYINGSLKASASVGLELLASTYDLVIGNEGLPNEQRPFLGYIDGVRIWDRALSQQEIQLGLYRPLSGTEADLRGCWTFDDGLTTDSTPNSNDGYLRGNAQILTRPGDLSVSLGANVKLTIRNALPSPIIYQWLFNGQVLAGKTNSALILSNVKTDHSGTYTVSVASGTGIQSYGPWVLSVDETFTKITTGDVVSDRSFSTGCAWIDYDSDNGLDLFVSVHGGQNLLYKNTGNGSLLKVVKGRLVEDYVTSLSGVWGDYDNDGFLDVFVANLDTAQTGGNILYRNNRDGTFAQITSGPVASALARSVSGAWGDFDNDGNLDLFVANSESNRVNFLYRNNADGTFSEVISGAVVNDVTYSPCASWADYNSDGSLDLFVTTERGDTLNSLYRNEGDGSFTRITSGVLVNKDGPSKGCAWADYNNDGHLDLFVAGQNVFYSNNKDGTFSAVTGATVLRDGTLTVSCAWGDYDNDGWLDLYIANENGPASYLFHNNGDGSFTRVLSGSPVTDAGVSRSCAWGDYDRDGFLDLFVSNGGGGNFFYRNNGNGNRWITVKCVGVHSNRSAIGAKVRVKATVNGRELWQMREISGGSGYGSQNDLAAHFGLKDAARVETLRIEWPSGIVQEIADLGVNQFVTVTEPPLLAVGEHPASGGFELVLTSRGGFNYSIEASEDLVLWRSIGLLNNVNGSVQFLDRPASPTKRFYRAVWLP